MRPALREHVVLLGAMGSGKTTIGRLLAERLGRAFVDGDVEVQSRSGLDSRTLFLTKGREELHRLEDEILLSALSSARPLVISPGASVVDAQNADLQLRTSAMSIFLDASDATLAARVGDGSDRPLGSDATAELVALNGPRRSRYEQVADFVVCVDAASPDEIVAQIIQVLCREVTVELDARSYPVLIGPGVRHRLADLLPAGTKRAVIVTQENVGVEVDPGVPSTTILIGDGESTKSIATIERLCREFARFGLTRADVVIAVGGGVVTDAAGFAASCYHRGVAYVNVSTTLLGQIDAAVGGKTAVNIPEGKNLIGAFWQPAAVICDTDTLSTLPEREWQSGFGEMVKYAFLGVDDLDKMSLVEAVTACVQLKADVVTEDEREGDRRMLLNYGHTLAHALEAAGFADGPGRDGVDLRHGEAVAIGIAFAARLAQRLGRIDADRVERHLEVLAAYGLPAEIPAGVDFDEILVRMARDKKATDGLTFILDSVSGCEIVSQVDVGPIRDAFDGTGPGSVDAQSVEVA